MRRIRGGPRDKPLFHSLPALPDLAADTTRLLSHRGPLRSWKCRNNNTHLIGSPVRSIGTEVPTAGDLRSLFCAAPTCRAPKDRFGDLGH